VRLKQLDRALAVISWVVAAVLALMLLIGPKVIAEDKGQAPPAGQSPYAPAGGGTASPDGKALFVSNCGSCHTLGAAGTNGQIGPKLDGIGLDAAAIETVMNSGPGAMPSFKSMPPAQRHALAKFVAASSR
jgi:mono/diheme cytochrome c family protein